MDYTKFLTDSLVDASLAFFEELGIKVLPYTSEPIQLDEFIENPRQYATKHLDDIKNIYYVGTVAESSFDGSSDKAVELKNIKERYEGLFIFAIEMKEGTHMTRSDMADLTRAYNRASLAAPVILLIKNGIFLSFCICERTEYKRLQEGEKIGKVTILRDLNLEHPHRGHLQILNSIEGGKCHSFEELYEHLMSVFSSELLTRQFYTELQNWYFWAVKNVQFPNDIEDDKDDEKYNNQNIIRLITRLIFVWFLKRKGLINPAFFDVDELKNILNSFQPNANNRYNYYRAILQNLFFATLNQKIEERRFVTKEDNMKEDKEKNSLYFGIKRYFRNFDYFKIDKSKPKEDEERRIVDLFNQSPNVNGSLFECLDNRVIDGHIYCFDGFSNSEYRKNNNDLRHPYLNEAKVPNILFFGTNVIVDLSKEYDSKKMKEVEVNGIINILKHYNFTVEENTPMEEDVALDPELLGKAFENLLGAYNPETKSTARKNTGSYYTPRPIVNYMVKESLHAYLKTKVPEVKDESIDSLLSYNEDKIPEDINPQTSKQIMTALYHCKILDPACGSGAFPMGCLQQMVHILRKLDANNSVWEDIVLDETIKEAAAIGDVPEKVKIARRNEIKKTFEDKLQNADYARKLYIIENCIYGVDIQTVAVQISRLRFFISLLCEQHTNNDPKQNYGVLPLPNLESNFVAANTLVSVDLTKEENDFLNDNDILSLKQQLRENRHKLFMPKDNKEKEELKAEDARLRQCIEVKVEQLYHIYVESKIKAEEDSIDYINKSLAELNETDMMDQYEVIKSTDLFGVTHEERVKKVSRKTLLLQKLHQAKAEISRLQHHDKIKKVIDTVKRLTSWDMFDQNTSSPFFDSEWMFDVKDGFDIAIANPPYISAPDQVKNEDLKRQREYIKTCGRYKTLNEKWDLYIPFIERGLQAVHDEGVCMMIVPYPLTNQKYGIKMRQWLCEDNDLVQIVDLNGVKVFENVTVTNCIPLIIKRHPGHEHLISHMDKDKNIYHDYCIDDETLIQDKTKFLWNLSREVRDVNLYEKFHVLGDYCYISKGMVLNADEKTAKGAFKKEDLISATPDEVHNRKYIEAKNIDKYVVKNVRYLEYDTPRCPNQLSRPTFRELYEVDKILTNSIGNLKVLLDKEHFLHNHSMNSCVLWKNLSSVTNRSIQGVVDKYCTMTRMEMEQLSSTISLEYLLGILNSSYADYLLTNIRSGASNVYPQYLRQIPIPPATKEEQDVVGSLAIDIANKANSNIDYADKQKELDNIVMSLYNKYN